MSVLNTNRQISELLIKIASCANAFQAYSSIKLFWPEINIPTRYPLNKIDRTFEPSLFKGSEVILGKGRKFRLVSLIYFLNYKSILDSDDLGIFP